MFQFLLHHHHQPSSIDKAASSAAYAEWIGGHTKSEHTNFNRFHVLLTGRSKLPLHTGEIIVIAVSYRRVIQIDMHGQLWMMQNGYKWDENGTFCESLLIAGGSPSATTTTTSSSSSSSPIDRWTLSIRGTSRPFSVMIVFKCWPTTTWLYRLLFPPELEKTNWCHFGDVLLLPRWCRENQDRRRNWREKRMFQGQWCVPKVDDNSGKFF